MYQNFVSSNYLLTSSKEKNIEKREVEKENGTFLTSLHNFK